MAGVLLTRRGCGVSLPSSSVCAPSSMLQPKYMVEPEVREDRS